MAVKAIILVLHFLSLAAEAKSKAYQKLADAIGRLPLLFITSVLLISTAIIVVVSMLVCIHNCAKFLPPQLRRVLGVDSIDVWPAW